MPAWTGKMIEFPCALIFGANPSGIGQDNDHMVLWIQGYHMMRAIEIVIHPVDTMRYADLKASLLSAFSSSSVFNI